MRADWLLIALLASPLAAVEPTVDPVAALEDAFARQDHDDKQHALFALAQSNLPDHVVLPLLVWAVADRQVHADAVAALRERTGLRPPTYEGQSHFPGYPPSDHPASWQYWLEDWRRAQAQDAAIDAALQSAREAEAAADRALAAATKPEAE